jgi:exonuclease SbcC
VRPVRLEVRGFTSFRDPQVLEFAGLDLFAISGPTGSGKSSLLDAMTYALYGYAERVGKGVGQLVSQGQKRMAVLFDFEVDGTTWRITRSTPSGGGASKVKLERAQGDDWVQGGEGADRIRDVDARVKDLIGLDYDGFTRSVVLPQGRFQEFMVGDAKERRRILTDLLGLELFERLARRAGELERAAGVEAITTRRLLDTEYEGVTPEAIAAAEAKAGVYAERETRLAAAEEIVRALDERSRREHDRLDALTESEEELRGIASAASEAATELARLAEARADAIARVAEASEALDEAARLSAAARQLREEDEAAWGSLEVLAAAREHARRLPEIRSKAAQAEAGLAAANEGAEALARTQDDRAARASQASAAVAEAEGRTEVARARLEELVLVDRAAAVRAELHVGDACPVCGSLIEVLPDPGAPDLADARADVDAGVAEVLRVQHEAEEANSARAEGARAMERDADARARLTSDLREHRQEVQALEAKLADVFEGDLPEDPTAALTERIDRRATATEAERLVAEQAAQAEHERAAAVSSTEKADAGAAAVRSGLRALAIDRALSRARKAVTNDAQAADALEAFPDLSDVEELEALATAAADVALKAEGAARAVTAAAERAGAGDAGLLAEAEVALRDVGRLQRWSTLPQLVEAVAVARRESASAADAGRELATRLSDRLDKRLALEHETAGLQQRHARLHDLVLELRADRIVAFLQAEALRMLAAAGSERLAGLSGGRYRLAFQKEAFSVVDTWNGDEMRSARTLSGGETFLASLALALALADQVQALAVTPQARLESLFLDEGFGTLDPESLEVVVEAIEQLGGDGRMVGIISHVQELAIRLPARIEVEKSPRGSRLVRVG